MGTTSDELRCPVCKSEAVYKYGHIRTGKQRLKCVVCGRQFLLGNTKRELKIRPTCPQCGHKMHLYMHDDRALRFRCSDYPECKSYQKIPV